MNRDRDHGGGAIEVDAPHQVLALGDLSLEQGTTLLDCELSYVTHGTLNFAADNAILVLPSIGGDHHRHDFLIGPGRALDPDRYFIVAVDALGNGFSTSPSNSRRQYGPAFPVFGVRDLVLCQRLLMDALGIARWRAVCGASFGGMQALQWAVSHPLRVGSLVALTPMARAHPWSVAVNEATRLALFADPTFDGITFTGVPVRGWRVWAALMQGLITRTPKALAVEGLAPPQVIARIQDMGNAMIAKAGDPWNWIRQSQAYDSHDISQTPGLAGDLAAALRSISAPCLIAGPALDLYNPAEVARDIASGVRDGRFLQIPSQAGHDAASSRDEAAAAFLNQEIAMFLSCRAQETTNPREDVTCQSRGLLTP